MSTQHSLNHRAKRKFIKTVGATLALSSLMPNITAGGEKSASKPNFVIVFTDDQGYGDLGCYGSETIKTPRIDQLANEGMLFTDFYAQPVCGPSRSALLTGRYPVRSRGWGMPGSEITMGEILKEAGYATGCIGKWDVSSRKDKKGRVPNDQGFDYFWGTLGANDTGQVLMHDNRKPIGIDKNMATLTQRYTDKGIEFLKANKDKPFLLYLAHTMPHIKIDASPKFKGKSNGGLYGDTIEEIDFNFGRLMDTLEELDLRKNTIVIFTSDNGPWNNKPRGEARNKLAHIRGTSNPLRDGKASTYEGGFRVPCIVSWPNYVPAGQKSNAIFSTLDFMPTFASLAGAKIPNDRIIDGVNQTNLLLGKSQEGARNDFFYFQDKNELHCLRQGKWKLRLPNLQTFARYVKDKGTQEIELYDLETDIGESNNIAKQHPEIVAKLIEHVKTFQIPKKHELSWNKQMKTLMPSKVSQ